MIQRSTVEELSKAASCILTLFSDRPSYANHSASSRDIIRGPWTEYGSFDTARRAGLRFFGIALLTCGIVSPAAAQLRTGRDTERDFYPADIKRAAQSDRMVIHASSERVIESNSKSNQNSSVVHAGCKNCQAGIPHSHLPMATSESEESVTMSEPEPMEVPTSMPRHHAGGSGLNCDSVGACCDRGCNPHPLDFLGLVLRRSQLRIEAVTFWPEGQDLPQLVTTRRPANNPATDGLIGGADTIPLFGGREVLGESVQGVRGEFGTFFDDCQSSGILLRFFDAGSNSESYTSTTGEPVVMRPFFSTEDNAQSTIAINYPNSTSGTLDAGISSELYGGDLLFRKLICSDCDGKLEFLAGYQTARLADELTISSTTTALTNTPAPTGTVSTLMDHFQTTNRFNGMALGLSGLLRDRCWSLAGMVKLGFGNQERAVQINGSSTITVPGNPPTSQSSSEGLLARGTNNGNYVDDTFVVTPEVNLSLGYRFTRNLEATFGYTYLGLPKVARVADQLDPRLEANLRNPLTGDLRPSFALDQTNFSLHSLNYGLQWKY
jgi:hypothetical protein